MIRFHFSRRHAARLIFAAAAFVGLSASSTFAGTSGDFASKVIGFYQGTGTEAGFGNASAALGAPDPVTGVGTIYPNVVDPFSPAYSKNQIVQIGRLGQLTLQLAKPIVVANTPQVGIVSNVGLIDANYPGGIATSPATIFGGGSADVRVSDGKTWVDLGNITFNLPATAWSKLANAYEAAPTKADVPANFAKPFTGTLASFKGENFARILNTLNGSVGGTWLNVYKTHLKTVDYIQIRNPGGTTNRLAIDSVMAVTATPSAGGPIGGPGTSSVPLPPAAPIGLTMLAVASLWNWFRGRIANR